MGVLGSLFPGPEISDEGGGESGDGQPWRLGPIDLENGVVQVHRPVVEEPPAEQADPD